MEWDDLKYFLELARTGTLTAAARRLEVQHSTVARRISRLEREYGQPLFARDFDGYRPNRAGQELLIKAEEIAAAFAALGRDNAQQSDALSGTVRVGVTEGFGSYLLPPCLARFRDAYPGITLHVLATPRAVQMPRNEVDIVITVDRQARGPYRMAKLTDYRLGLFAAESYLARRPLPRRTSDLGGHDFVSYVPELEPAKDLPKIEDVPHTTPPKILATSLAGQKAAVLAGCGIALMPHFLCADEPQLRLLLPEQVTFRRTYYISVAEEIRHIPRIDAFWTFMRSSFQV